MPDVDARVDRRAHALNLPRYASVARGDSGSVDESAVNCVHCGAPLPDGARFCPSCGRPKAGGVREEPVDLHVAEPRYFGLGPPVLVFSIAVVLLAVGVFLLARDDVAAGALLVLLSICLLPAFMAGARRWP